VASTYFVFTLSFLRPCKSAVFLEWVFCWTQNPREMSIMGAKSFCELLWTSRWRSRVFCMLQSATTSISYYGLNFYSTQYRKYECREKDKHRQDRSWKTIGHWRIGQIGKKYPTKPSQMECNPYKGIDHFYWCENWPCWRSTGSTRMRWRMCLI
jgi:hypothetical protein